MAKGYFSILQFSPDPAHSEAINIGILLSVPELQYLNLKITDSFSRVSKILPQKADDEFIKTAVKTFKEMLLRQKEKLFVTDELDRFIKTRAHEIRLTPLRTLKVNDPEIELAELFTQLVPVLEIHKNKTTKVVFPDFDKRLRSPEFASKIELDQSVTMPITGKEFFAPYSYVNGRKNLIKTTKIDGFDFVERLAAEGRILDEKLDNQLIVVSDIEMRGNDIPERVCRCRRRPRHAAQVGPGPRPPRQNQGAGPRRRVEGPDRARSQVQRQGRREDRRRRRHDVSARGRRHGLIRPLSTRR
jgi:hypothetical protein